MTTKKHCDQLQSRVVDLKIKLRDAEHEYQKACRDWWLSHLGLVEDQTILLVDGKEVLFRTFYDRFEIKHPNPDSDLAPWVLISKRKKNGDWSKTSTWCARGWEIKR